MTHLPQPLVFQHLGLGSSLLKKQLLDFIAVVTPRPVHVPHSLYPKRSLNTGIVAAVLISVPTENPSEEAQILIFEFLLEPGKHLEEVEVKVSGMFS